MNDSPELFSTLALIIPSISNITNFEMVLGLLAVIILLFLLALTIRFEVAVLSLDNQHTEEFKTSPANSAKTITALLQKPKHLLYAIFYSKFIVKTLLVVLVVFISTGYFNFGSNEATWMIIQILTLTIIALFFAEVFLKALAMHSAQRVVLSMAKPYSIVCRVFYPLSFALEQLLLIIGTTTRIKHEETLPATLLESGRESDASGKGSAVDDKILSRGIVKFGNIYTREIMKSRMEVVAVEKNTPFDKLLKTVVECGYSRIPVYIESFDEIAGILYIKDLLPFVYENENFEWVKLIRPCIFVPEGKKIKDLLKEFQERKILMAIVVDEYGGTSGIITLEDILEEIVGEIYDESDEEETFYSKLDDRSFVFEGKTLIKDFCNITGVEFSVFEPIKGEADTIAGLILEMKQEMPLKGEMFEFDTFTLMVESVDNRRVKRIKMIMKES